MHLLLFDNITYIIKNLCINKYTSMWTFKTRDITKVCKRCGGSGVMDIGTMLAVFVKCDCLKNKEK